MLLDSISLLGVGRSRLRMVSGLTSQKQAVSMLFVVVSNLDFSLLSILERRVYPGLSPLPDLEIPHSLKLVLFAVVLQYVFFVFVVFMEYLFLSKTQGPPKSGNGNRSKPSSNDTLEFSLSSHTIAVLTCLTRKLQFLPQASPVCTSFYSVIAPAQFLTSHSLALVPCYVPMAQRSRVG